MSFNYPVCLNLEGQKCVVIGGGSVAERKVRTLLQQKACVTVIAPVLCPQLAARAEQKEFVWLDTYFAEELLQGAFLVIAATDKRDVNHAAAEYCREHNILVNVGDSLEESSFIVNSYFTKGDLLVAVSTGGVSPALSRRIRQELEQEFDEQHADILTIIAQARREAMTKITDSTKRREFLQEIAQMDFLTIMQEQSLDTLRNQVKKCLSSYLD